MDFELTPDQVALRDRVRGFCDSELRPIARKMDREWKEPPLELRKKLAGLGVTGLVIGKDLGGMGLDTVSTSLVLEELAAACASTAVTVSVHNSVSAAPLINFGTEEQKQEYLPKLAKGELWGAFAVSEAGAGSDVRAIKCKARRDGDDWVLSGEKMWITNGSFANFYVLIALGEKGHSAFCVPTLLEGFSVPKIEEKMGLRGSSTSVLVLDDVRLPGSALLGLEGKGLSVALATLDGGRIGIASQALGIARSAYEEALADLASRQAAGEQLGQGLTFKLADMATRLQAARLLIYRAASKKDRGESFTLAASMAKLYSTENAMKTCIDAVQLLGERGLTRLIRAGVPGHSSSTRRVQMSEEKRSS
jgi:butyryl-CoA dehydrogenase